MPIYYITSKSYLYTLYIKRKRKRSDSVLWQKPLHQQKCQKGKVTTQTTPKKSSIKQRLRTDLGRSVGVTAATQLVWLTGLRLKLNYFSLVRRPEVNLVISVSSLVFSFQFCYLYMLLQFVLWTLLIDRCHHNKISKLGLLLIASNSDLIISYSTTEQHGNSAQRVPSFLAPRQRRRHNSTTSTTFQ